MDTVRLGRTGLEVSVVGLGCGGSSRLGLQTGGDEAHATRVVEHAIESGINFIDTSITYGTEAAVGRAIQGKRDRVVISTKASTMCDDRAITAADLAESLDRSLSDLNTDYIDVFHLHSLRVEQYPHCLEVLLPELQRQQRAGKVRFLGVTEIFNQDPSHTMLQAVMPDGHFDVAMVGFNLLNPSARRTVFPAATQHDVGTLVMFSVRRALSRPTVLAELVAGLVASGQLDANELDRDDPLGFVSDFAGVGSIVEAAYRFCRHEPGANVILTGTGDPDHLDHNIRAILKPPLPALISDRLNELFGHVDTVSGN